MKPATVSPITPFLNSYAMTPQRFVSAPSGGMSSRLSPTPGKQLYRGVHSNRSDQKVDATFGVETQAPDWAASQCCAARVEAALPAHTRTSAPTCARKDLPRFASIFESGPGWLCGDLHGPECP
jgi:hypothetical protein